MRNLHRPDNQHPINLIAGQLHAVQQSRNQTESALVRCVDPDRLVAPRVRVNKSAFPCSKAYTASESGTLMGVACTALIWLETKEKVA